MNHREIYNLRVHEAHSNVCFSINLTIDWLLTFFRALDKKLINPSRVYVAGNETGCELRALLRSVMRSEIFLAHFSTRRKLPSSRDEAKRRYNPILG